MLFLYIPRVVYRTRSFGGVDIFGEDGSYLFASWYIGPLQVIGSKLKRSILEYEWGHGPVYDMSKRGCRIGGCLFLAECV